MATGITRVPKLVRPACSVRLRTYCDHIVSPTNVLSRSTTTAVVPETYPVYWQRFLRPGPSSIAEHDRYTVTTRHVPISVRAEVIK